LKIDTPKERVVVALGGNALMADKGDTFETQIAKAREGLKGVLHLIKSGYSVVITHGNGPQVGAALLRMELSAGEVLPLPLYACGAQTQGEIGFIISAALTGLFHQEELKNLSLPWLLRLL
jgi:carbamate kinase